MSLRGRQSRTATTRTFRFLIVTAGEVCFALQADYIQGLLTVEEAGPAEALAVQGFHYPSMDLTVRLQLQQDAVGPDTRIVLFAKDQAKARIPVSQVHGLREVEDSQVIPLPRQFRGEERTWYQGVLMFEQGVALVLNPAWLVEGCVQEPADAAQRSLAMRPTMTGAQN